MSPERMVEDAAADWLVRRHAILPPGEEAKFQAWLAADPRHARALGELAGAWEAVSFPCSIGQADFVLARLRTRELCRRRRRKELLVGTSSLIAAVVVLAFASWRFSPAGEGPTVALRPDHRVLPDGSTVDLSAHARIAFDFSGGQRRATLRSGAGYFVIAQDRAHPFVVSAGGVDVRAVGTEFVVNHAEDHVDVAVTEGRVALQRSADGANLLGAHPVPSTPGSSPLGGDDGPLLAAGQRATWPAGPLAAGSAPPRATRASSSEQDVADLLAWRSSRVEFTRTPLAEAVALFNRHNRLQISIADSAVAGLRISGVLWTNDAEGFLRLLEQGFDVEVIRDGEAVALRRR